MTMRAIPFFCCALLALRACDFGEEIPLDRVSVTFTLTNTQGHEATSVTVGDEFDLNFTITNNTGRNLTFHHSGPPVIFRLETHDSLMSSSIDGLVWIQVVLEGTLADGETYSTTWRAPNTPWSGRLIIPLPGQYRATVSAGCFFDQLRIRAPQPIGFVIEPRGM
jgi:hypothetical protein